MEFSRKANTRTLKNSSYYNNNKSKNSNKDIPNRFKFLNKNIPRESNIQAHPSRHKNNFKNNNSNEDLKNTRRSYLRGYSGMQGKKLVFLLPEFCVRL